MDNYISLVSGQAPEEDTQEDCSTANVPFGSNSTIVTSAPTSPPGAPGPSAAPPPTGTSARSTRCWGRTRRSGATGTTTTNGCTYPSEVATLFDQFNLAGVSWKGYAQDLGGAQPIGSTSFVNDSVPGRDDGPCGAPGASTENPVTNPTYLTATTAHPLPSDVSSFTSASLVAGTGTTNNPQYSDQYVAKHFPFPWFESLIGSYNPTTGATGPALTEPRPAAGQRSAPTAMPTTSPTSTARPTASSRTCRTTRSRRSAGSPRTTAVMPTTRRARATTSRAPSASTPTAP